MTTQRLVVALLDGLGVDCFTGSPMPALKAMAGKGFYKQVKAVTPTVTNVNNVSVCCGAWPDEHGISANSYFDAASGQAAYMNSADMVRVETLFQRALKQGTSGALLTSKKKTVELFHKDTVLSVAAEAAPTEFVERYGAPPDIYSAEINYWLWTVAADILKSRPDIGVLYVHTTDYPMHRWSPEEQGSLDHLSRLDTLIEEATAAAPDAALFAVADHGMNRKTRCWDLARVCASRGVSLRFALSPERDYYIVHHRNFAGSCWLWLRDPSDRSAVETICRGLEGVEDVITREEAMRRFRLPGDYIGDLMVLGDKDTVFGDMEREREDLPPAFRAHGSLHESDVPLLIHGWQNPLPESEYFTHNLHLTSFLF
ncbi:MAG: alkaline phosphatase family protein [Nitrospirae bacterium]|nr:alkaline phosphatase family protein [Nitrospirota bacterium]